MRSQGSALTNAERQKKRRRKLKELEKALEQQQEEERQLDKLVEECCNRDVTRDDPESGEILSQLRQRTNRIAGSIDATQSLQDLNLQQTYADDNVMEAYCIMTGIDPSLAWMYKGVGSQGPRADPAMFINERNDQPAQSVQSTVTSAAQHDGVLHSQPAQTVHSTVTSAAQNDEVLNCQPGPSGTQRSTENDASEVADDEDDEELAARTFPMPYLPDAKQGIAANAARLSRCYLRSKYDDQFHYEETSRVPWHLRPENIAEAIPAEVQETDPEFYDLHYIPAVYAERDSLKEQLMNIAKMDNSRFTEQRRGTYHESSDAEAEEVVARQLADAQMVLFGNPDGDQQDAIEVIPPYTPSPSSNDSSDDDDVQVLEENGSEQSEPYSDYEMDESAVGVDNVDELEQPINDLCDNLDVSMHSVDSIAPTAYVQTMDEVGMNGRKDITYPELCKQFQAESELPTLAERNKRLEQRYLSFASTLFMNETQSEAVWDFIRSMSTERKLQCYKTIRERLLKLTPKIKMKFEIRHRTNGMKRHFIEASKYPEKKFPRAQYETLSSWTYASVEDVYNYHLQLHGKECACEPYCVRYDLCLDGVPLSQSGVDLMNILCVRFELCQLIYILGIFINRRDNEQSLLEMTRLSIKYAFRVGFFLRYFIADSPMRAKLKNLKGHNGYCACDRCLAVGMVPKGVKRVVYPKSTMGYAKRSHIEYLRAWELYRALPEHGELTDQVAFGVKGISILEEDPGIDLVESIDIEPMHNLGLGVCKKLMTLILKPTKGKDQFSKEATEIVNIFDKRWTAMALPSEFNRRPRKLMTAFKHYKAEEYVAVATCGFLAFSDSLPGPKYKEIREVWLTFAYLMIAALLPDVLYSTFKESPRYLELIHKSFYNKYNRVFTDKNCTYNTHVFYHLPEVRAEKCLDAISAENFESRFGDVKKVIKNNTCSFAKSVMQRCFIALFKKHSCEKTVRISANVRRCATSDSIIYAWLDNYPQFFEVTAKEQDEYKCYFIRTERFYHDEVPSLNFEKIGVRRYVGHVTTKTVMVHKKKVLGKGVRYEDILINVSFSALHM